MRKLDQNTFNTLESSPDPSRLLWNTESRRNEGKTVLFEVNSVHRKGPEGREGDFVELDFARGGVTIIPYFTGSDGVARFVMERQFRHGTESVTLEFPAGLVEKGESASDAAARELWEETGLRAAKITELGSVCQNSAYMRCPVGFCLAEDMSVETDLKDRSLDQNEQIDILTVPVSYVLENIGEGELTNGAALLAVPFFLREMRKRGLTF
ncbi:MAG: NUDIX hydrolase [Spirochaetales bacterium]|nr:NUDIX hydrolase [Spirochaetales bacterium]MBQ6124012.1 NUDIX hydrolase [Spirochaetales bacterium]